MNKQKFSDDAVSVGYEALKAILGFDSIPHFRKSYVILRGSPHKFHKDHFEIHYYTKRYLPKNPKDPFSQLEFALRYDGFNLEILKVVFEKLGKEAFTAYVKKHPTSKMARRLWYLYELFVGEKLEIDDAKGGSYTLLLDSNEYYTCTPLRSRRHYVDDNLLGGRFFCPVVRRTSILNSYEQKNFTEIANNLISQYDSRLLERAIHYLYVKETMSSYQIEREKPDQTRTNRFVELLKKSDHFGPLTKETLIDLQNSIVDPRFADRDYRNFQNYIGTEARLDQHYVQINYIAPKPEDVVSLMQGLLESLERMIEAGVHPVIIATTIAFGFVFIHPFGDGNGRLHRFLIHYIFSRTKFVPNGVIFPISAVILKNLKEYDQILEEFSHPLMQLISDYQLNKNGEMKVNGETDIYYRFIDYTRFVEYLFACVEKTIQADFKRELAYLVKFDIVKKALQEIVDMPDKELNLFIRFVIQNHGSLSSKKRESFFTMLTDHEIKQMEQIINEQILNEI